MIIFMEMKVIAFLTCASGPTAPVRGARSRRSSHGFKVLAKEDFTPTGADAPVFTLAPVVTYLAERPDAAGHPVRAGPGRAST